MTINYESWMKWAREQAPKQFTTNGHWGEMDELPPRPIRLEIAVENCLLCLPDHGYDVIARVYLREPRCTPRGACGTGMSISCECGPLAEMRIV